MISNRPQLEPKKPLHSLNLFIRSFFLLTLCLCTIICIRTKYLALQYGSHTLSKVSCNKSSLLLTVLHQDKEKGQGNTWEIARDYELNMTSLSEQQKWAGNALGTKGFCTLTPASIQIRELAESGGRWKPSLFDQTVVMTSSRSSNLLLKSPNTVEIPHGFCLSMSITVCT